MELRRLLDNSAQGERLVTRRRGNGLAAAVRAALESLATFDEQELEDDEAFFSSFAVRLAEAVEAEKAVVLLLGGGRLRPQGAHGFAADVLDVLDLPEPDDRDSV